MKIAKLLVLALIALSVSCLRAEMFKIQAKNLEVIELYGAFTALDGAVTKVVPQGDKPSLVVAIPYEFSGKTRLTIARNIAALEDVLKSVETARVGLIKQVTGGGTTIAADDTVRRDKFFAEYQKVLDMPVELQLTRLTEAELNLDINPVPGAVIKKLLRIIK